MSILAPLFLLGGGAIALPIIAHLIRRRPRGELSFSSLMFLKPSPPTLTRRSRLDHWPLLLLRTLVILLLAAAFSRPFLRTASRLQTEETGRRMVLMIDTSASMRRAGLWEQMMQQAETILDDLQPQDQVAVVAFDESPRIAVGFQESSRLSAPQRRQNLQRALRELKPTWKSTELGRAINFASELASTYEADDSVGSTESAPPSDPGHLILLSDIQSGSSTETLQATSWPDGLRLDVRRLTPAATTNAWARILNSSAAEEQDSERVRVRVANSSDADNAQFHIGWGTESGEMDAASRLPVQVPPGETRVVRMPPPEPDASSLVLEGDDQSFDNARYFVQPVPEPQLVPYHGPDSLTKQSRASASSNADRTDSRSLFYYLSRVPLSTQSRSVTVEAVDAAKLVETISTADVPLAVVARSLSPQQVQGLRSYAASGGQVLLILSEDLPIDDATATIRGISGDGGVVVREAEVDDYAMLSRIDFDHHLFSAMADPQFNDFTKIRFWSHRKLIGLDEDWSIVAKFDSGDPAFAERQIGEGSLTVMTSGWHPAESQLALSSKFPPLILSFFPLEIRPFFASVTVGDAAPWEINDPVQVETPAGETLTLRSISDFQLIDRPGVYTWIDDNKKTFAVNLAEAESRTDPLDEDDLEQYGLVLGKPPTNAERVARDRQLRDLELENSQKLWQWLLASALVVLGIETWLGGWLSGRTATEREPLASA